MSKSLYGRIRGRAAGHRGVYRGRFDARDRVYGWSYGGDQYGGV